jgi:hypothetical protein
MRSATVARGARRSAVSAEAEFADGRGERPAALRSGTRSGPRSRRRRPQAAQAAEDAAGVREARPARRAAGGDRRRRKPPRTPQAT